ncbi:MAG: glutamine-hydrolyzing carbamoyl-phosphate synthase small subunit [Methanosarcinales archaeon]|nr:MAG: glutamine-hydrolyzing carbamoyl-phosphate synthase small subunit [Methanosarcinales archaeon]
MKAVLGLEDGTVIKGKGFGAEGVALGELVFATSFTGYEEALTDPSYNGQILMMTYPLIGNYGVSYENFQSEGIKAEGFVVREVCNHPSHSKSKSTLHKFLKKEGIPGICDVDTRMLTILTREKGAMRAALIVGDDDGDRAIKLAKEQNPISELDLISKVTCAEPYQIKGHGKRFVVMDLGVKRSILSGLSQRGVDVVVVPADATPTQIQEYEPDALLLSNGPGDPMQAKNAISIANDLVGKIPIFGIGLGHQVIALALGAKTYKLKFGHRGANQPVKDVDTGKIYITSQNHGFAVDPDSLNDTELRVTQVNVNDGTVEGLRHTSLPIMSAQYYPEVVPSPRDVEFSFDAFMKIIGGCDA